MCTSCRHPSTLDAPQGFLLIGPLDWEPQEVWQMTSTCFNVGPALGAWEAGMDCPRQVPKWSREFLKRLSASEGKALSSGPYLHGELGRTQIAIAGWNSGWKIPLLNEVQKPCGPGCLHFWLCVHARRVTGCVRTASLNIFAISFFNNFAVDSFICWVGWGIERRIGKGVRAGRGRAMDKGEERPAFSIPC